MEPYRILSIDGGGIRGLYAAVLLDRLAAAVPGFLERVHLFAGTSTGGIIALGLARGLPPAALVALYRDKARDVFDRSPLRDLRQLGGLIGARYNNEGLRTVLADILGAATLADLPRRVLVPTFDLDNHGDKGRVRSWKPKFFHNFPGPDSDSTELAVDVAVRTSAAPTYFPVYQRYVDGGLVANDPSMAALAQALDPGTGNQPLDNVRLLSVGTGLNPMYIEGENMNWGLGQWAARLVPLMIDGVMDVARYQCERLLGERYCRLEPILPAVIALDAADQVGRIIEYAQEVDLTRTVAWIRNML